MTNPNKSGPLAVIDVGTSSVRMSIAQINEQGRIQVLDHLKQTVSLGADVFKSGSISAETTEACVEALRAFRRVLDEYRVSLDEHVYAVATSAVREARNRDVFVDRVYMATGILLEVVDEAEVNRLTYLAIQPLLSQRRIFGRRLSLVCEVGGGSTEILGLSGSQVRFAFSYHLGSLRIREMMEEYQGSTPDVRKLMENHIRNAVMQIERNLQKKEPAQLLLMGGEARCAAAHLRPDWDKKSILSLPVAELENWTNRVLGRSVDELVRRYQLSYPDAETLAPTLLCQVYLARALNLDKVFLCTATLRDGLLMELASPGEPTGAFSQQIERSALALGHKYKFDRKHAEQVAYLSQLLFAALKSEHRLQAKEELLLRMAALLHDIGGYISNRGHHKHSMYLIRHSDIFGLGPRDLELVALVARYHRKALPSTSHFELRNLKRSRRLVVEKLAAILRMADALDRGHGKRIRNIEIMLEPRRMVLLADGPSDLTLEQMALDAKSNLFEQVYGRTVLLRSRQQGSV